MMEKCRWRHHHDRPVVESKHVDVVSENRSETECFTNQADDQQDRCIADSGKTVRRASTEAAGSFVQRLLPGP